MILSLQILFCIWAKQLQPFIEYIKKFLKNQKKPIEEENYRTTIASLQHLLIIVLEDHKRNGRFYKKKKKEAYSK